MRPSAFLLGALLLFSSTLHLPAGDRGAPELDLVPADAVIFAHVRVAEIWRSDAFKEWRDTVLKAGAPALAAFDQRFFPPASTIECMTAFVLPPAGKDDPDPLMVFILETSRPIDQRAFLAQSAPAANEVKVTPGKSFYHEADSRTGIYFPGERALVFGSAAAVRAVLTAAPAKNGPLTPAIAMAHEGKPFILALNPSAFPAEIRQQAPPAFRPLIEAKLVTLTLDFAAPGRIELRAAYGSEQAATDADQAARAGLQLARFALGQARQGLSRKVMDGAPKPGKLEDLPEAAAALVGLGILNRVDELLANPPLKRDQSALQVTLEVPVGGPAVLGAAAIGTGLLVPAVQKVREAASRTQDMNNLKQMALAMHNWADVNGKGLPPAAICDKNGKPLLSWRVAILPFLEQDAHFRQFKLDEPWDSEHNKKAAAVIPMVYMVPGAKTLPGQTHYRVFVGGGALFNLDQPIPFLQILDGTSNTLLIVETAQSVPWSKPDEIPYDAKKPLPQMGAIPGRPTFNAALADGSVRAISVRIPEATLRAMITRAGGETIGPDQ